MRFIHAHVAEPRNFRLRIPRASGRAQTFGARYRQLVHSASHGGVSATVAADGDNHALRPAPLPSDHRSFFPILVALFLGLFLLIQSGLLRYISLRLGFSPNLALLLLTASLVVS